MTTISYYMYDDDDDRLRILESLVGSLNPVNPEVVLV